MPSVLRALLALSLFLPVVSVASPAQAAPDNRPTFIVTLRDGEPQAVAAEHARRYDADIEFVYEHALRGYAAKVSEGQIGALARDSRVRRVERDGVVHAVETTTQTDATWGLDRIDDLAGLDTTYEYSATGAGVTAYIIDTGIRTAHNDFGGRATSGFDAVDGGSADDCNGHGTHVAGTVGGSTWGVAKSVSLVAVRVLDCNGSGTWSGVIAGIDWVTEKATDLTRPAVANMSLSGGANSSVDDAVRISITSGVSYAIAAGNGDRRGRAQDACNYSPARVPEAMTIGATDKTDTKTSWSNYGDCVDWFAPGAGITSAWHTGDSATNTISGTSMATPHVAGAAALYLQGNSDAKPETVRAALYASTTKDIVTSSKTANNDLLYTGPALADDVAPTPTDPAPSLGISLTANAYRVKGVQHVDLTWTGTTTVDVYRDDKKLNAESVSGDKYTDNIDAKGGGSYTYKVCEAGATTTCSNEVTVTF